MAGADRESDSVDTHARARVGGLILAEAANDLRLLRLAVYEIFKKE
jgi:hypothetical protein